MDFLIFVGVIAAPIALVCFAVYLTRDRETPARREARIAVAKARAMDRYLGGRDHTDVWDAAPVNRRGPR